jgi:predicted RNase H-like nuclease (RuvC/YqgF family)
VSIVVQIFLSAIVPLLVALVAGWLAIKANKVNAAAQQKVEQAKVDAQAYDRAKGFYESMLQLGDKRLDQVEKRCQQLERQVDQMQRENDRLEIEVAGLRTRLVDAGLEP